MIINRCYKLNSIKPKIRKTFYLAVLIMFMFISLSGCKTKDPSVKTIGISAPSNDIQRWAVETVLMRDKLREKGYEVIIQYASSDISMQISQIENLIAKDADVLIVIPIESASLGEAMDMAAEHEIPVISYDMLITNTDAVSYYTTFDNYRVGTIQGQYVKDKLDLDHADRSYNIEFTAGDPGDNNAGFFYNGAVDVLKPYLDSGVLKIVSGQDSFGKCATPSWNTEKAQQRAENILASYYNDTAVDVWVASNDTTALGVSSALAVSYKGSYPLITGQDCTLINVKNILNGKQAMSVFKDPSLLIDATVNMVDEIFSGKPVTVNDTKTYYNGVKIVPSYLCEPVYVDKDNCIELLTSSGFYTIDQLQ